jgi:hypothetical protein
MMEGVSSSSDQLLHGVGGWVGLLVVLVTSGSKATSLEASLPAVPIGGAGFAGFFSTLLTAAVIMIEVELR